MVITYPTNEFRYGDLEDPLWRKILATIGGSNDSADLRYDTVRKIVGIVNGATLSNETPLPGDEYVDLLRKLVRLLGGFATGDTGEWQCLHFIADHLSGSTGADAPRPGDEIFTLVRKILDNASALPH